MNLLTVAWRPFRSYRQEDSATRIHLIDAQSPKCLCGKQPDFSGGAFSDSPAAFKYCKRCLTIARKAGVTNDEIRAMAWKKAEDRG